ncbi:hypothetical protein MRX96_027862 [Rhipicephalus microplus]
MKLMVETYFQDNIVSLAQKEPKLRSRLKMSKSGNLISGQQSVPGTTGTEVAFQFKMSKRQQSVPGTTGTEVVFQFKMSKSGNLFEGQHRVPGTIGTEVAFQLKMSKSMWKPILRAAKCPWNNGNRCCVPIQDEQEYGASSLGNFVSLPLEEGHIAFKLKMSEILDPSQSVQLM